MKKILFAIMALSGQLPSVGNVMTRLFKVGIFPFVWIFCIAQSSFVALGDTWTDPETGIEWTYTTADGYATVGGGNYDTPAISRTTSGNVKIPSKLGASTVNAIADHAFYNCYLMQSVEIPDTVETIGSYAFAHCWDLSSVIFSENLQNIGDEAFFCCSNIREIVFPETLKKIGRMAFAGTLRLDYPVSVRIPTSVVDIGGGAFVGSRAIMLEIDDGSAFSFSEGMLYKGTTLISCLDPMGTIWIPDFVSNIAPFAFWGSSVEEVIISASVTNVEEHAFSGCHALESVDMADGVRVIGDGAFGGCGSLKQVSIPSSVRVISNYAFEGCETLERVTIGDGVREIGFAAFARCKNLLAMVFPASVKFVGGDVFSQCASLTSVFFDGNVPTVMSGCDFYNGTSTNLVTYVVDGAEGWPVKDGGSALWPLTGTRRAIHVYSGRRCAVDFDLGTYGVCTNGIAHQIIAQGCAAVEPMILVVDGWRFVGWDQDVTNIGNDMEVHAVYERLAGINISDALDNDSLIYFHGDGEKRWEVVADTTAKGGYCLRCGPLTAGQSAIIKTRLPAGRGALTYNVRFASSTWGATGFTMLVGNSGWGASRSTTWNPVCVSLSGIEAKEATFKLQLNSGNSADGQICWLDDVQWLPIEDVLGRGLEFQIDDEWFVKEDVVWDGGKQVVRSYASVYNNVTKGNEQAVKTRVAGPGVLRFKHCGSLYSKDYVYCVEVDNDNKIYRQCSETAYSEYWPWSTVDVPILTKGLHTIRWVVRNEGAELLSGVVGLCDVEWIPAPANITVVFDSEGGLINGQESYSKSYATGESYGSLPTPIRENRTFNGWYTEDGAKVVASDYVIPSATNLFARWVAKLDGTAGEVVKGNEAIYSDRNGIVIPLHNDDWGGHDDKNYFEVTCAGEAIVSFDWVVDANPTGDDYWRTSVQRKFTVDGEPIESKEDYGYTSFGYYNGEETCSRIQVRTFLTPGNHTLRWTVPYGSAYNATVRCAVENFKVEPVEMQSDIADWVKLLADFKIWKPGNLAYLRDSVYGARITANPNDYEARVIRAAIKLALLAENTEIRKFIKDCGWTIADYTMKKSGQFCGLEELAPANDIVDRLSPVAMTALDDALADLNAIPENWNGAIELSPEKYEVLNESVYVDMAEITMFKASIESVRASILLVKGYDFTMDYVAVSNATEHAEYVWDVLGQAPEAGYIRDANALLESKTWFKKSLQHLRRADQIIQWRTNPLPHFFEYDLVDADNLARARLYLEQLIGSLDHPETIDLPYFVDKFGYKGETLPMGMFRQLYLGAIFAGRVTKDLVPEVYVRHDGYSEMPKGTLFMDSIVDITLGGLFPDLGFKEFATLFPCSQYWPLALYAEHRPQSRLLKNQTLTVADESVCDGTLEYTANLQKLRHVTAQCIIDGLAVDTISVGDEAGAAENRSVAIPNGSQYELVFTAGNCAMKARQQIFEIVSVPEVSPVGDGIYSQTIKDVTWNFTVSDDEATITGVSGTINGDLSIPEKLGGRVVTAIGDKAFMEGTMSTVKLPASIRSIGKGAFLWCESLTTITFLGDEPTVGKLSFDGVSATVVFKGGTVLSGLEDGKWQGMTVQYVDDVTNEDLRVCASLPDGYEFNGMATLSLSVNGNATIYFTMNGAEPTTNALVYSSPISVSITTRIKYFAVDNVNGDSGPVGSLLLKLVTPDSALLSNSEYSKTVNGIAWSYQEQENGVRLTGNTGTAAGEKVAGAVVVPDAINWQPVKVVGAGLFASCEGITSVKIPATVTDIERDAFRGCTHLETINLPDGLLSIADGAFERCTSLTNVVIPASVTNIGYFAFRDCLRLTNVVLKGDPPRQDLGVYMGVPAFTTISGRMGSVTAIIYAEITNDTNEITVPESWLDELAVSHDKPAGADSYRAAFVAKYGDDFNKAVTKPTGKYDLKGNPLYVWQDYVAGTDPLNEEDQFTATITMEDGLPVVHWSPELPKAAADLRKYTIYGATALDGKWDDVTSLEDPQRHDLGYQFFKVTVEMK